jgi:hypothetical protein
VSQPDHRARKLDLWLPLALKAILLVGTLLPLLAAASVFVAWRNRRTLNYILAATLLAYIPFVTYWNSKI